MFDAERFCNDYEIDFQTAEQSKHARHGWIQIVCPFCKGNPGWHGGFNIDRGYYNCWRCGNTWLPVVIQNFTGLDISDSLELIKSYTSGDLIDEYRTQKFAKETTLPDECIPMTEQQRNYLIKRNYDPDELIETWGLLGTGNIGEYNYRIIAPIFLNKILISYQGRDYTGLCSIQYKACAAENEVYRHQHTLYGIDNAKNDTVIICEGITDVWRIGPDSVATFGIEYTAPQIRLLASKYKNAYVLFDNDPQAQVKAEEIYYHLIAFNIECEIITLDDYQDPGQMLPKDARQLRKALLFEHC